MRRYWTCHWQFRYWKHNRSGVPIQFAGSNKFRERGVRPGDVVFIVSMSAGRLYLGGRMIVHAIVSRDEAVRRSGNANLFDNSEWIVGRPMDGTPLDLTRRLSPELARRMQFVSPKGPPKGLFFVNETDLDVQATRGIRQLTPESARLLEDLLLASDSRSNKERLLTLQADTISGASRRGA